MPPSRGCFVSPINSDYSFSTMLKSSLFSAAFSFFVAVSAFAQLFTGEGQPAVMDDVLRLVKPGSVRIITEDHGNDPHHQNQRDLLVHLSGASFPLSVGMEFLNYTDQPVIDSFLKGDIGEWEFLDSVRWVGP